MTKSVFAVPATLLLASLPACGVIRVTPPAPQRNRLQTFPGMRLVFEPEGTGYVAKGSDHTLFIAPSETVLTYFEGFGDVDNWFREERFRVHLLGSSPVVKAQHSDRQFDWLDFDQVYPNIRIQCGGTVQRLEYHFIGSPGADYNSIRIRFEGPGKMRVDSDACITAKTPLGQIRIYPPVTEESDGERRVKGRFVLVQKNLAEFRVPS